MNNNEVEAYKNEFAGEIREVVATISWLGQGEIGKPVPSKVGNCYDCIAATSEAIDCDSNENLGFINIKWLGRKKGLFGYKYGYHFLVDHKYKLRIQRKSDLNEYYVLEVLEVLGKVKTPVTKKIEHKEIIIETIEYDDDRYGKVSFEHDLTNKDLYASIDNVVFAGDKLETTIFRISDDINLEDLFVNLKKFSDNSELIKERIYPELFSELKGTDNFDEDGNIFEITEQFLRDNFCFTSIFVEDPNVIQVWGCWEPSGNQDYTIKYNCDKDTIEIELL